MKIALSKITFFLGLSLAWQSCFSQINADFTVDLQQGCSPLIVHFTNQSSGSVVDYDWEFGNGNPSDSMNPTAIYIAPGTYTVKLIAYGAGGQVDSVIKTGYITVFENPTVSFDATPTIGCVPTTVEFSDLSSPGDAPISTWEWDFGDGVTSTQQNPTHTYQNLGSYTVTLQVEDQNTCTEFLFEDGFIQINNPPTASFTGTDLSGCQAPHTVNFTSTAIGTPPFTYQWDFGDGNISTDADPSHTYNTTGTYDIKLVVVDQTGCSDSLTKSNYVTVETSTAAMSVNTNYGCSSPPTNFQFNSLSTGPQTFLQWNFGDGTTSQIADPTHQFNAPGVYDVMLIVGGGACRDTAIEVIYVQQLQADFSLDPALACAPPMDINFTDQSTNAVSWQWDFDDGTTDTDQNPSHTYLNDNTFDIQLTVTDTLGCISSTTKSAQLDIPQVSIDTLVVSHCIPAQVLFFANVTSTDPAQTYDWTFGTGAAANTATTQYTYTDTGEYQVTLTVMTDLGCVHADTLTVEIGDKPTVFDAYVIEDSVCRKTPANLNITSDFGENYAGFMTGDPANVTIADSFANGKSSPGDYYFPITIKGIFHGCEGDDFIFDDTLLLYGPFCDKILPDYNCTNPYEVEFGHNAVDYQVALWDFGNGATSSDHYPTYTYSARGRYTVNAVFYDTITNCDAEASEDIFITEPIAAMSLSDTFGCGPLGVIADGSNSQDADLYLWRSNFSDLNLLLDPGPHSVSIPAGDYSVSLTIGDIHFCQDTITKHIKVLEHENQIIASSLADCVPASLDVLAQVTADTTVSTYTWDIAGTAFTDSAASSLFNTAGSYPVSLITSDLNGCSDTSSIQFIASDPKANFIPNRQLACIGDFVAFINTSNPPTGLNYQWDLGDGTTSSSRQPTHQYSNNDTFNVSLIVSDSYGCKDTIVRPEIVKISSPTAGFSAVDTFAPCPPLRSSFFDESSSDVVAWLWNFGDNSSSSQQNPGHSYNRPGSFDVQLTVQNAIGCQDVLMLSDLINVGGPTGDFIIDPPEGCPPLTSTFYIVNQNDVAQITWDFGDGSTTNGDSAQHTYFGSGNYYPNVVLLNDNNCSFSYQNIDTVMVDTLDAAFATPNTNGCTPATFSAFDNSIGNVVAWTWELDGTTFTGPTLPQQQLTGEGDYDLKLIVENPRGCIDSIEETVTVFPLPIADIEGDSIFCENEPKQLFATADTDFIYRWLPVSGLNDPASAEPLVTISESVSYRVIVTDANGCTDTSEAHFIYVQPELQVFTSPDTIIVLGDTASLRATTEPTVNTYQWSPSSTLTCDGCPNPQAFPEDRTSYTLSVEDPYGCDQETAIVIVDVIDDIKIAMPEAFTPNGDDVNDVLLVNGWNIKELLYFKVFNRWGELIFESTSLQSGWDGTYKGEPQNMDSYVYVVKAVSFKDKEGFARGSFSLIR